MNTKKKRKAREAPHASGKIIEGAEAAQLAGVGVDRVRRAIEGGGLEGSSLGRGLGLRTTEAAIERWILRGCPETAPPNPEPSPSDPNTAT